jgi:hypothetical protein
MSVNLVSSNPMARRCGGGEGDGVGTGEGGGPDAARLEDRPRPPSGPSVQWSRSRVRDLVVG